MGDEVTCADLGDEFPSVEDFNAALGGGAIALYVVCAIVVIILSVQFGFLSRHFLRHVPDSRKMATFWINSVYLVVACFTMFSLALPKASEFVWLFYRIYLSLAMGHFVTLTMNWYGGETAMMESVGHDTKVDFRVNVMFCLCLWCPNGVVLTKTRIRYIKAAVFQMPYIQGSTLFLMTVIQLSGYLDAGNLNPAGAYFWLTVMLTTSFFTGVWGLFVLFGITNSNGLLIQHQFVKKALVLKIPMVLINIQGLVIDIMGHYGPIPCIAPYMSAVGVGGVIKCCLYLGEAIIFGSLAYNININDISHL